MGEGVSVGVGENVAVGVRIEVGAEVSEGVSVCFCAEESVEITGVAEVKVAVAGAIQGLGPQLVRNSSIPVRETSFINCFSMSLFL
jgi:tetrahydrodipicolinate N-succinyltransferase